MGILSDSCQPCRTVCGVAPVLYSNYEVAKSAEQVMGELMKRTFLCTQVLTQAGFVAARQEGTLQKHADGSWGPTGELRSEERPLKRVRQDVSAAAGGVQQKRQHGRRCAVM